MLRGVAAPAAPPLVKARLRAPLPAVARSSSATPALLRPAVASAAGRHTHTSVTTHAAAPAQARRGMATAPAASFAPPPPSAATVAAVRSTAIFEDMDYYALIGSSAQYNMPLLDTLLHLLRARAEGSAGLPPKDVVDATAVLPLVAELGSPECVLFVKETIDAVALVMIACDWGVVSPSAARSLAGAFAARALRFYNPNELSVALRVTGLCKRPATVALANTLAERLGGRLAALSPRDAARWHPNSMCHALAALAALPPQPALFPRLARAVADEVARRVSLDRGLRKAEQRAFRAQQMLLAAGKTAAAERVGARQLPGSSDAPTASESSAALAQQEQQQTQQQQTQPPASPVAVLSDSAAAGLAAGLYAPHAFDGRPPPPQQEQAPAASTMALPQDSAAAVRAREQWLSGHLSAGGGVDRPAAAALDADADGDGEDEGASGGGLSLPGGVLADRQVSSTLVPRTARLAKLLALTAALGGTPRWHPLWQAVVDKTTHSASARQALQEGSGGTADGASHGRRGTWSQTAGAVSDAAGQPLPILSATVIADTLWALALAHPKPKPHASLRAQQAAKAAAAVPAAPSATSAPQEAPVVDASTAVAGVDALAGGVSSDVISALAAAEAAAPPPSSGPETDAAVQGPAGGSASPAVDGGDGAATTSGVWTGRPFVVLGRALLEVGVASLSHDQLVRLLWAYTRTGYWTQLPPVVGVIARELAARLRAGSAGPPPRRRRDHDGEPPRGSGSQHHRRRPSPSHADLEAVVSWTPVSVSEAARAAWCLGSIASAGGGGGPSQPYGHWLPAFFSALQDELLRRWAAEPTADWSVASPQAVAMLLWGAAQARAGVAALVNHVADAVAAATHDDIAAFRNARMTAAESHGGVGGAATAATPAGDSAASPSTQQQPLLLGEHLGELLLDDHNASTNPLMASMSALSPLGRIHAQPPEAAPPASPADAGVPLPSSPATSQAAPPASAPASPSGLHESLARLSLPRDAEAAVFASSPLRKLSLGRWSAAEVTMAVWALAQQGIAHRGFLAAVAAMARPAWWVPLPDDSARSRTFGACRKGGVPASTGAVGASASGSPSGGGSGGGDSGVASQSSPTSSSSALPPVQFYWLSNLLYSLATLGAFPAHHGYISAFARRLGHLPPRALVEGFTWQQLQMVHLAVATAKRYNTGLLRQAGALPAHGGATAADAPQAQLPSRDARASMARGLPLIQPFPQALVDAAHQARMRHLNMAAALYRSAPPSPFIARARAALGAACAAAEAAAGVPRGSVLRPAWELMTSAGLSVDMAVVVTPVAAASTAPPPSSPVSAGGGDLPRGKERRKAAAAGRTADTAALLRLAVEIEGPGHFLPLTYRLGPVAEEALRTAATTAGSSGSGYDPRSLQALPPLPHPFTPGATAPLGEPVPSGGAPATAHQPPLAYNAPTRAKHALLGASGWVVAHVPYKAWEAAAAGAVTGGAPALRRGAPAAPAVGAAADAHAALVARCIAQAGVNLVDVVKRAVAAGARSASASAAEAPK